MLEKVKAGEYIYRHYTIVRKDNRKGWYIYRYDEITPQHECVNLDEVKAWLAQQPALLEDPQVIYNTLSMIYTENKKAWVAFKPGDIDLSRLNHSLFEKSVTKLRELYRLSPEGRLLCAIYSHSYAQY